MGTRRKSPIGKRDFHSAGFTLLEVMVAMLLLSVIITSSVSLLFMNIRGWDGLVADSEMTLGETLINDRLVQALRHLSPMVWKTGGERRLAFEGEPESVHFISQAPQQYRAGGLFEYFLVQEFDSDNRANLILYYAPYFPGQSEFSPLQDRTRRILMTDTGGISFSYFGANQRNRETDWWERWEPDSEDYPVIVRINFVGREGGGIPTELVVPRLIDRLESSR